MQKYIIALAVLGALFLSGFLGVKEWVNREVRLHVAEKANEVTNDTLTRIEENMKQVTEETNKLHQGVSDLAVATQRGLSSVRREVANAKTINLGDPLPGAIAESLCVQYHKANSRNTLHREGIPDTVLQLQPDAFAERCRAAWARVTWGDVVEWLFPLMEHDGGLQRQLDAGRAYYAPKEAGHD
jgi:hypothetical protein